MRPEILTATTNALRAAAEERFFRTERGYHGRFYCMLQAELDRLGLLRDGAILEMEYQKAARHHTRQRPDIVFHIPVEHSGSDVRQNNFAVFALKRHATRADALEDFSKLDEMCAVLEYPLDTFINVDAEETFLREYRGRYPERLHAFAVVLSRGQPRVLEGATTR